MHAVVAGDLDAIVADYAEDSIFGKPEGLLERQVPRWLAELDSYSEYDGYPGPDIPGIDEVSSWLERHRPATWIPDIMHDDYHAANVMFSHRAGRRRDRRLGDVHHR